MVVFQGKELLREADNAAFAPFGSLDSVQHVKAFYIPGRGGRVLLYLDGVQSVVVEDQKVHLVAVSVTKVVKMAFRCLLWVV